MGYPAPRRPTWLWISLGFVIALAAVLVIYMVLRAELGAAYSYSFGVFGGFFLVFLILWIVFFVVRIAFWSSRARYGRMGGGPPMRDPAVMIARQRYARGEITREQYEQILSDLYRRGIQPPLP